jgi:glycine/D-amino acid oxidase-like deaminating enzyme/nitrite reductase/ring-hydroxylating ferredoxin subunit
MGKLSIWRDTAADIAFPALEGTVDADVAIVGGGITGLTLAMLLSEGGKSVALLEARRIGLGSTGHSTGNLYEVLSEGLHIVGDKWGRSVMGEVAESRRHAVDLIERTAVRLDADCGFRRCTLHRYATTAAQTDAIDREYRAATELGLPARLVDRLPVAVASARILALDNQAQFHPLVYLRALARRIAAAGCRLYEHSAVIGIDEDACTVHTARGTVRAREIVLATHTPKGIFLVQAEMVPQREYGIAVRLAGGPAPDGIFWGIGEYRHSLRSLRANGTDYLIVVGEEHSTGRHDAVTPSGRLEAFARRYFDVAAVAYRWSAQNYRPADGLPYIGRSHTSDLYIATGFATDGLTYGTVAAGIIADQILGRASRWAGLYRANRLAPVKGARGVLEESVSVAKALVQDYAARPHAELASIAPGSGAVVSIDGERLAAFRDASGALSVLSPVCPHMKCIVRWNAAEQSWDCPCHGSRFDVRGEVIEGPALSPLARRSVPG